MWKRCPREVRLWRLGAAVRQVRARAELSLDAAADLVGVNRSTLSTIENGHRCPHRSTLMIILEKLGASKEETDILLELVQSKDPRWPHRLRGSLPDYVEPVADTLRLY